MQARNSNVTTYTGATVNGVQTEAEVIMQRATPQDWPLLGPGLDMWESQVKALAAVDFPVPLHALRFHPKTGGLYNLHKGSPETTTGVVPTRTAIQHLMSYAPERTLPASIVDNLQFMSPATRAAYWLTDILPNMKVRDVNLRTAVHTQGQGAIPDQRVIRAVVSDIHSREHGDDLAVIQELRKLSGVQDARLRVVKRWDDTHVEVVLPNKVREVRKGVVIQARVNLRNSETKGGSFEAAIGSMNLVCLNGMISQGNGTTISIRHTGDIRYKMAAGVKTVLELASDHLDQFAKAYDSQLPGTRAEAIERLAKRYQLPATTAAALQVLWDVDGQLGAGNTVAGAVNALTRHAQSQDVSKALDTEAIAGKVLSAGLSAFM